MSFLPAFVSKFLGIDGSTSSGESHFSDGASDTAANDAPSSFFGRLDPDNSYRSQRRRMADSNLARSSKGALKARPFGTAQRAHTSTIPISDDEKRLIADYSVPADRVELPTPHEFACLSTLPDMRPSKPGHGQSFKPLNTLDRGESTHVRKPPPKTYGNKSSTPMQEGQLKFLDQHANFGRLGPSSALSTFNNGSMRPSKRIKMSDGSPATHEVITLDDEEPMTTTTSLDGRSKVSNIRGRSGSSVPISQRSTGRLSGSRTGSGVLPSSSFTQTMQLCDPHRKKPRRQSQHASAALSVDRAPFAIDTDVLSHATAGKRRSRPMLEELLGSIPKHASSDDELQGEAPVRTSKHFAQNINGLNRVNPSSGRRPGIDVSSQSSRRDRSPNLRDRFRRVSNPEAVDDADELGEVLLSGPPRTRGSNPRDVSRADTTALSGRGRSKEHVEPGWRLSYARSSHFHEVGDDLRLVQRPENQFDIEKTVNLGHVEVACTIDMSKINRAQHDNISRVRLEGPRIKGGIYWFDLRFSDTRQFRQFLNSISAPATIKVFEKDASHMESTFANPLDSKATHPEQAPTPARASSIAENGNPRSPPTTRSSLINELTSRGEDRSVEEISRPKSDRTSTTAREGPTTARLRPTRTTRNSIASYVDDTSNHDARWSGKEERKYSIVHGLGRPWPKPVTYQSGRRRAVVNFEDLQRLDEGEFLNDALIDFYMIYAFEQAKVPPSKVYFFNTHFYTTLTRPVKGQKGLINYDGVKRWVKEDIFAYDYIVVPVCEHTHWYLAIICNVSNISRKPNIEGLTESSPAPPSSSAIEKGDVDRISSEGVAREELPPPMAATLLSPDRAVDCGPIDDENLFDEEQRNVEEQRQRNETQALDAPPEDISARVSPATQQAAKLEDLTLADTIPKSIIGEAVASPEITSKKPKQRMGLKKYALDEPIILVLDSLGNGHPKLVKVLKEYILEEGRSKRSMDSNITSNAFYPREQHIPMQPNFTDCGVYLLGYVEKFFRSPRDFVTKILNREMDAAADWGDMNASAMRNTIREILQGLAMQQELEREQARKAKRQKPKEESKLEAPQPEERPSNAESPKIQSPSRTQEPAPKPQPSSIPATTQEERTSAPPAQGPPPVSKQASPLQEVPPTPTRDEAEKVTRQFHPSISPAAVDKRPVQNPKRRSPQVVIPKNEAIPEAAGSPHKRRNIDDGTEDSLGSAPSSPKKRKTDNDESVIEVQRTPPQTSKSPSVPRTQPTSGSATPETRDKTSLNERRARVLEEARRAGLGQTPKPTPQPRRILEPRNTPGRRTRTAEPRGTPSKPIEIDDSQESTSKSASKSASTSAAPRPRSAEVTPRATGARNAVSESRARASPSSTLNSRLDTRVPWDSRRIRANPAIALGLSSPRETRERGAVVPESPPVEEKEEEDKDVWVID